AQPPTRPPASQPADGATLARSAPGRRIAASGWRLTFDTGDTVMVAGLTLVGRSPEGRPGEPVRHAVALPSQDMSLSKTHAQFHLAGDGALVVTDRGSTNGSILIRQGVSRDLTAGRPFTLLPGDRVLFGDRAATVGQESQ
ncbi:FHA domain-containing protein, partial [Nocardioides dubius]